MRRNVTAAVVQLLGLALMLTGAFLVSWEVGLVAVGLVVLLVGIDVEGGR